MLERHRDVAAAASVCRQFARFLQEIARSGIDGTVVDLESGLRREAPMNRRGQGVGDRVAENGQPDQP
jgi:hypothetical protein